jgi:hypothetical protein
VSALNGRGGTGGGTNSITGGNGGDGGLGRIRISVTPATCTLAGTFTPSLAYMCRLSTGAGMPGLTYIAAWPH